MKKTNPANLFLLFLTAFIWGTAFVAQSVGLDYVGPFTMNSVRSLLGGIVLLPVVALSRKARHRQHPQQPREPIFSRPLLVGSICCGVILAVASSLQQFGLQYTTVGKSSFITALYVVLVPIISRILGKKIPPAIWLCVGMALAGLYLLCFPGGDGVNLGDVLTLICALVFSVHILFLDHYAPLVDGILFSSIQFLVCGLICAVPMLLWEQPEISQIFAAWKPICYAGILSCGVGYTGQMLGQKGVDPTIASLVLCLESVFGVLAGWVVLGQSLSLREGFGCLLMFAAIILTQLAERKSGGKSEEIL